MKRRAKARPRRRAAPAASPWLLKWWPVIALALVLLGKGADSWITVRIQQETRQDMKNMEASFISLSGRISEMAARLDERRR